MMIGVDELARLRRLAAEGAAGGHHGRRRRQHVGLAARLLQHVAAHRAPGAFLEDLRTRRATPFIVDSPNGFKPGDWLVATNRLANCALTRATAIVQPDDSAWPPANVDGQVKIAYAPAIRPGGRSTPTGASSTWGRR